MQNTIDGSTRIPVLVTGCWGQSNTIRQLVLTLKQKSAGRGDPRRRVVQMAFAGPKLSAARPVRPSWGQLCAGQIVRNALLGDDGVR